MAISIGRIMTHFSDLPDPRKPLGKRHVLSDMLVIAICAVICGAEGWCQVEEFGRSKKSWFQTFLELPHGIPSHDTFGRVFAALDPSAFERCFMSWVATLAELSKGKLVSFDGKSIRRSFAHAWDASGMAHLWSARSSATTAWSWGSWRPTPAPAPAAMSRAATRSPRSKNCWICWLFRGQR